MMEISERLCTDSRIIARIDCLCSRSGAATGTTLTDYVNQKRIDFAIYLLNATSMQIQTIAQYCGMPDVNYFTRTFKRIIGITPSQYRRHTRGE